MSEQWYCPSCGPMRENTIRYELHDVPLCSYCGGEIDMESTENSRNLAHLYSGCYAGHCCMDLMTACPMQNEISAEELRRQEGIYPIEKTGETPEILWPALRQYRHNSDNSPSLIDPEQGFVCAFDYDETLKVVATLLTRAEKAEAAPYKENDDE